MTRVNMLPSAVRALLLLLSPLALVGLAFATLDALPITAASATSVHFAVIGDYGNAGQDELDVSNLVRGWNPDFIITTGDNNYNDGAASTIDPNIGQYYHDFIFPYTGGYGPGAPYNKFFPSLGNHDWYTAGATPYLNYFALPNNERYYDFASGPVHFYALDSDGSEPDGNTSNSTQAIWLQARLAASTEPWKLVYMHHPPYSSGSVHGNTPELQWPYLQWGATAVLAGHDHEYERIILNGLPYFVNGLGGKTVYSFGAPIPGSIVRYNGDYGAMLVDSTPLTITFRFITRSGMPVDTFTVTSTVATATPTPYGTTATPTSTPTPPVTQTPTHVPTNTATPMPSPALVGHVNWQGPPPQPSSGQQLPVTLTLRSGAVETNYPSQSTDPSGFFTVSVAGLPNGTYSWRAKGPKYLATSGSVDLQGADLTTVEMGSMRAGDADNSNVVNSIDFAILRSTFGLALGQQGYDDRADFTTDHVVNSMDFNAFRANFGQAGAP
jgi:tartrate-resistant acid phosphatase type 5